VIRSRARVATLLAVGAALALTTSGCDASAPARATRSAAPSHSTTAEAPAPSPDLLAPYAKGAGPFRLATPLSLVPIRRIAGCVTDPTGLTVPQARQAPRAPGNHDACLRVDRPVLRVDHVRAIGVGQAASADGTMGQAASVNLTLDRRDRTKLNRLISQGLGGSPTEPPVQEVATVVSGVIVTTPQGIVSQLSTWPLTFATAQAAERFRQAHGVPSA
jgi:hypothetical protein